MNRDRIRKILLVGLLLLAIAAFGYFALFRTQSRHPVATEHSANEKDEYYCPMHPTYRSEKPGNCPICSMKLVKLEKPGATKANAADMTMAPSPPAGAATP